MPPIDTAELRRLWEAATKETSTPQDLRKSMNAAYLALPALLDELEAAREAVAELKSERDAAVLILKMDGHATDYALGLLDARDRHQKLIGAAEELERIAANWYEEMVAWTATDFEQRAAKLRQEVEDGRND